MQLAEKEQQAKQYNELEELFEQPVSRYQEMADTRSELRLLKALWDFKGMLIDVYKDWKRALWKNINTDDLETQNKNLLKLLRKAGNDDPIIKGWQVYRDIEDNIKNMSVVLPLINELHSPRCATATGRCSPRTCGVDGINPTDPKFTMDDMMKLKLHEHVDDVSEIVETAQKEKKIEKKLKRHRKGVEGVRARVRAAQGHGDVRHQVERGGDRVARRAPARSPDHDRHGQVRRVLQRPRAQVAGVARQRAGDVLKLWETAERASWASLESIFPRERRHPPQLPDDTKRFEGIDSEFKELMKEAVNSPTCRGVLQVDGREVLMRDDEGAARAVPEER